MRRKKPRPPTRSGCGGDHRSMRPLPLRGHRSVCFARTQRDLASLFAVRTSTDSVCRIRRNAYLPTESLLFALERRCVRVVCLLECTHPLVSCCSSSPAHAQELSPLPTLPFELAGSPLLPGVFVGFIGHKPARLPSAGRGAPCSNLALKPVTHTDVRPADKSHVQRRPGCPCGSRQGLADRSIFHGAGARCYPVLPAYADTLPGKTINQVRT
jgi:hypothetical protein